VLPPAQYRGSRPWADALAYSTAEQIKERRSAPPAMRLVNYIRPEGALRSHVAAKPRRAGSTVEAVMLAVDGTVLPLAVATIEIAEQIRVRLMGIHKRIMGNDPARVSWKFSGKTPAGAPLEGHKHAFILPLENAVGRIDRVLIHTAAPGGFDHTEQRAILGLRTLYQLDRDHPLRTVVTWKGDAADPAIRRRSEVVASATPFVTARHWRKGRGSPAEFLEGEVRLECRRHGLPEPAAVEMLSRAPGLFDWIEFRRNRKDDPPRAGYGFRLRFPAPVAAPFSLGYGCHFGLGRFEAE
jgi:CRISPR-associated protein Csb2